MIIRREEIGHFTDPKRASKYLEAQSVRKIVTGQAAAMRAFDNTKDDMNETAGEVLALHIDLPYEDTCRYTTSSRGTMSFDPQVTAPMPKGFKGLLTRMHLKKKPDPGLDGVHNMSTEHNSTQYTVTRDDKGVKITRSYYGNAQITVREDSCGNLYIDEP
jgi:hypothetical protein